MRRVVLMIVVLAALVTAGAVAALATPGGQAAAAQTVGPQKGNMGVQLQVSRFVKRDHRLVAKGRAVATYTSTSGERTVRSQPFSAHATVLRRGRTLAGTAQTTTCPVLTLELDQLSL